MKVKQNLMLLLALIVLVAMLASCSVYERPSLIATPPTTKSLKAPPVATTITRLEFKGLTETLTIDFDKWGKCDKVISSIDGDVDCPNVRKEFSDFIICISGDTAEKYAHRVNTAIDMNADIKRQLFNSDRIRGKFNLDNRKNQIFCAPMRFLSEGAVFNTEPDDGSNIRCGSSGGGVYCPR